MANPENTHPNQPNPHLSGIEQYDPLQPSGVDDGRDGLSPVNADPPPRYEQPTQQFPGLASKDRLHDDVPHTQQLLEEGEVRIPEHGLPADADPAMVAHAMLPPEAISAAITHDILDDIDRNGWDGPAHELSELEAARLEMQKKHYIDRIIPTIGGAALTWAALRFGIPAGSLSDSSRDNFAWVMATGGAYLGYVFSTVNASSPRRYRKAAQKEMKKQQKQEQQRTQS